MVDIFQPAGKETSKLIVIIYRQGLKEREEIKLLEQGIGNTTSRNEEKRRLEKINGQ